VLRSRAAAARRGGKACPLCDGRLIAFRSDRDGNGEIDVMNSDGSNQSGG
jgi:hypothetical protein